MLEKNWKIIILQEVNSKELSIKEILVVSLDKLSR